LEEDLENRPVNIGFGNVVMSARILAVIQPTSAPIKRLKEEAKDNLRLLDATQGRRTRAIIVTDSNHVILSAVQVETIAHRMTAAQEE
jgi:regulator of extracellular matrix RemA (YlzA/DUF370 family)